MTMRKLLVLVALTAGAASPRERADGNPEAQVPQPSAPVAADLSGVRPGPIAVSATAEALTVAWPDENSRIWTAAFSLRPTEPLIREISVSGKVVLERARPLYWCETGKRRGGWDEFFDFPPSHPQGTRRFTAELRPSRARVRTTGDRVEVHFEGMRAGIFEGGVAYTFYPGSRLIQQQAVLSTPEPDTAYFYDAGIRFGASRDLRPGGNMESAVVYHDTSGRLQTAAATGPERQPAAARFRTIAARTAGGSVAVFPPPHQYFFARDFTTNMGHVWSRAWRGEVALGIRQLPDDNTSFYPWMNAPPGTEQRMTLFLLPSDRAPEEVVGEVRRFTSGDRFPRLEGRRTMAIHWHVAYTVQAMEKGIAWVPPFKPVLRDMGIDAAMIKDFHGDGHPRDTGDLRLRELEAYYRACRAQSDASFLLIPGEEANVHLGGHWSVAFPKPVYWIMSRSPQEPFRAAHDRYGTVYRTANADDVLELIRREGGFAYQTHPRTKSSMGYPDKIRETAHFRDARYAGAGWKAMPTDLSTLRQGVRALRLLDDMWQWGLEKRLVGEVDVFQVDATHELYAHMNVNYVRIPDLPAFDSYGRMLDALARGDYFVSTGEVLLAETALSEASDGALVARAHVRWTFPLAFAEVVWGDGSGVHTEVFPLEGTRAFGDREFEWRAPASGWNWARLAVWDVAGNGAFINPVRRAAAPPGGSPKEAAGPRVP